MTSFMEMYDIFFSKVVYLVESDSLLLFYLHACVETTTSSAFALTVFYKTFVPRVRTELGGEMLFNTLLLFHGIIHRRS